jgi:hypothetical protein
VTSSHKVGFVDILVLYDVYMTREVNSLENFQWQLEIFSIKDVCSTSKNPQSNAIYGRMHQTVTNVLRTLVYTDPPQNMAQARDTIDDALATAMHAMQTTVTTTFRKYARCSCFFSRYVFKRAADCRLAGYSAYL